MDFYDKQHYSPSKTLQYEQYKITGKFSTAQIARRDLGSMILTWRKPETRGGDALKLWFVVNVIVLLLNNHRYIFIVRRLSILIQI